MQPCPAEIARTLAAGRLAGSAHVAYRPGPHQVRHATDPSGRVLLLVSIVSDLALALRPPTGGRGTAVALDVPDLPPAAGSPSLGRLWVSGWAEALAGTAARRGAVDFSEVEPTGDLLDVGSRFVLYRFEPAEIRLQQGGSTVTIDPGEYAAAEPDPLHAVERELVADLADHHATEIGELIRGQLGGPARPADPTDPPPRVVRIDRYGLSVEAGPSGARYRARLAFPHPVDGEAGLVDLLHPVLCRHRQRFRHLTDGGLIPPTAG